MMKNSRQSDKYDDLDKAKLIELLNLAEHNLAIKNKETERLKTSFLSNISHEIRTPMNAIIGFSDLLKDNGITQEDRDFFLDNVSSSTQQLLSIIENIIEAAQIESNDIKPVNDNCPVNELLENIYNSYLDSKKYKNKENITLKLSLNSESNPFMITDSRILNKIFINLIDNAIKFTEEGSIEFGYNLIKDNRIQFFVFDTGMGIPKDKYGIIFEKFRQIDDNFSKKHDGLGIGLTVSKKLIQLLNGKMEIVSTPGLGTKVYLSMPLNNFSAQPKDPRLNNGPIKNPSWLNEITGITKLQNPECDPKNWHLFLNKTFSA